MKKVLFTVAATAVISTAYGAAAEASSHKVSSGDSLWSIAKKYDTSVSALKKLNSLKSDVIYPNQVLKVEGSQAAVPAPPSKETAVDKPVVETKYTIVPGDTLIGIANKHSISLAELKSWNNLTTHLIYPGQALIVARGTVEIQAPAPVQPKPEPVKPSQPAPSSETSYKVQAGDTLSRIGGQFGVSVSQLKEWNGLRSDMIYIGQKLTIKSTSSQPPKEDQAGDAGYNVDKLIKEAKSHIGTPYVWGGSKTSGFDCSGFIYYVYNKAGMNLSRISSGGYYNISYYVNSPQPGDLVFFENTYKKGISHLGIYIGDNQFIHAGDNGVQITSLSNSYWKSKFDGFKRFY
ncbi:LysM peptidoglycan-binding domain-containing protein [Rossellomorea vietnamensis]|uniref:LysM peptidoglycan-binding domain-containing protein n=1 Tax=Rossellomorea vietnamensis TaxID=218284 RepID=A0A5D4NYF2_9BACI|nr:LysM peptidoglycan-binding domain-containing protein [Rossellomorea vietnamensis]TYS17752.1 LysM peptidoglycan-binding domain-containing protein [Rossellomorea vietnamensis]